MLLRRPRNMELTVEPMADYQTSLLALALASLRSEPTTLLPLERTELFGDVFTFLASGDIIAEWQGNRVRIIPGERCAFEFTNKIPDYELLKFAMVLAAMRQGSQIAIGDQIDDTIITLILALRRMGAQLEFLDSAPTTMIVKQPLSKGIKYHLQRENAKIFPPLVLAMASGNFFGEIYDLFNENRFDYLFRHFICGYQRDIENVPEPGNELERRLSKRKPQPQQAGSRISISGGIRNETTEISLKPDYEFAAYLTAGACLNRNCRVVLKGLSKADLTETPLGQLKRMGAALSAQTNNGHANLVVAHSIFKARKIGWRQLYAYPDAIGALALAGALSEGTSVIRSSSYSTTREERRRRNLCELIRNLGLKVAEISDGIVVEGASELEAQSIETNDDPICQLLAVAMAMGAVRQLEVNSLDAAQARWGNSFNAILDLLGQ